MTTNLNAIAGPSKLSSHPLIDPDSPSSTSSDTKDQLRAFVSTEPDEGKPVSSSSGSILKGGMAVDENGEMVKVPAFLQKLYTMVSDNTTDKLIYWSESGDSFFVPDHERFGKELLPRFFKHSNFSSFVRQLNMYGFHKVPQPQTGVLKVDNPSDSELWEFINPYFKRDQKELLHKVTRKNNRPNAVPPTSTSTATRSSSRNTGTGGGSQFLITDGTTEGEAGAGPLISPAGQMVDLAAITNGINAIRQTQASIGADLKALQASNEHLWREALESRERHRNHQETIDLIVTFLERLFGTEGEGLKGLKEALRRGGIGRPREDSGSDEVGSVGKKRKRLGIDRMISDGREEKAIKDDQIVEIPDDPFSASSSSHFSSSNRFQSLPSEDSNSPHRFSSAEPSRGQTPINPFATPQPGHIDAAALVPYFNQVAQAGNENGNTANGGGNGGNNGNAPPMSPNTAASAFNLDPALLSTSIGSLLQSPAAAQMFLNSLTHSAQGQALATPRGSINYGGGAQGSAPGSAASVNQLQNQQNNYFANLAASNNANANANANAGSLNQGQYDPSSGTGFTPQADPTLALLSPLPNYQALAQNNEALLKSYEDALAIGGDAEKLQEGIDSLVRSLGLQPGDSMDLGGAGAGGQAGSMAGQMNGINGMNGMAGEGGQGDLGLDSDFNVDDFLERFGKENADE